MTHRRRVGWQEFDEKDVDWTAGPSISHDNPYRELDDLGNIPQIPVPASANHPQPAVSSSRSWPNPLVAVGLAVLVASIMLGVAIGWFSQVSDPASEPVVIPILIDGPTNNTAPLPPALPGGDEPTH